MDLEKNKKLMNMINSLSDFDYDLIYALMERLYENRDTEEELDEAINEMDVEQLETLLGEDYLEKIMHWKRN
ncbi:Hypothetical protein ING2D1G_1559 [Peptoniphilus sp. ING2-D1G]|nr:Hypothetical protein ING2D1G_1559 [Peptoniphilus sp. ING2-D1G]